MVGGVDGLFASLSTIQTFAYNWGLGRVRANLAQREAERSCGIAEGDLTPAVGWSGCRLRKDWNRVKDQVAPWCEGAVPRFKGRRAGVSCRFTTGAFGLVDSDRRHVKLPRIGMVRTLESTRKLARHLAHGTARVRSVTVAFRRGRWLVSFSVEITRRDRPPRIPNSVVGVIWVYGFWRCWNPYKTSPAGNGYRHGKTPAVNVSPQGGTADPMSTNTSERHGG